MAGRWRSGLQGRAHAWPSIVLRKIARRVMRRVRRVASAAVAGGAARYRRGFRAIGGRTAGPQMRNRRNDPIGGIAVRARAAWERRRVAPEVGRQMGEGRNDPIGGMAVRARAVCGCGRRRRVGQQMGEGRNDPIGGMAVRTRAA